MAADGQDRVFEILRARGIISPSTQQVALGFMGRWGLDAFRAVIETHLIEESRMADILSEELRIPRLNRIRLLVVEKEVFDFIPYEAALEHTVFPFELKSDGTVKVAVADPTSQERVAKIGELVGKKIEVFVGERSEIISAIQKHYPLSKQLPSLVSMVRNRKD
jgi:type IV pilus assembly protein PilB